MLTDECGWVRFRLPLLAGGDLVVEERRKVERHLIGCLGCRDRQESSRSALSVLRLLATVSPVQADSPSLWPVVERQIRQSRHRPSRSGWLWAPRSVSLSWSSMGMALALGLVVMTASMTHRAPITQTPALTSIAPVAPLPLPSRPSRALPDVTTVGPKLTIQEKRKPDPFQPPPNARFDYDLEYGTPKAADGRYSQHSY